MDKELEKILEHEREHARTEFNVRFHHANTYHWHSHNNQFDRLPYGGKTLPIDKDLPKRRPIPALSSSSKKNTKTPVPVAPESYNDRLKKERSNPRGIRIRAETPQEVRAIKSHEVRTTRPERITEVRAMPDDMNDMMMPARIM